MKKILFILFIILLFNIIGKGQLYFDHLFHYQSINNPAYAGSDNRHFIGTDLTSTSIGLKGSPYTLINVYEMPLDRINSGLGVTSILDEFGPLNIEKLATSYNYKFFSNDYNSFLIGVKTVFNRYQFDENEGIILTDSIFERNKYSCFFIDFDLGIMYQLGTLKVGFSLQNLINPLVDFGPMTGREDRRVCLHIGYKLKLTEKHYLDLSFLYKNRMNKFSLGSNNLFSFNGTLMLYEKAFFGVSIRSEDLLSFGLQYNIGCEINNRINLTLMFDFENQSIINYSSWILSIYNFGGAVVYKFNKSRPTNPGDQS